ncbi:hypothetical protein EDB81DRAFT_803005 [Dactylonectria macrodidyma]|uniref:Uncharacterized protein n=1 Tax=Dactylonectria macrodidyma TaxID=307937 RepID=A0A9P9IUK5_9HYPO|nr:hypothetical protein EDB81DRAFT_803005 [Dactylonectria macrodidyma]
MSIPQNWQLRLMPTGQFDTTTLRQALTQKKPSIQSSVTSNKNAANKDWPELSNRPTIWDDFDLPNLKESYGHILDLEVPAYQIQVPIADLELAGVVIDKPSDVKRLVAWNDDVMKPTLDLAKSYLGLHPGIALRHARSDAEKTTLARVTMPGKGQSLAVDHKIELDDFPAANLVVGFSRPSSKWNSKAFADTLETLTKEALWPLRQLANACKYSKTRYGYIQTEEELVVCCFSGDGDDLKAAIKPIPWSRHGPHSLTTDLALWWLCMLAMADPNRRVITSESETIRINAWERIFIDEERGSILRHRYSRFEKPTTPPPLPAYHTPSRGNAAAFEAATGLQANGWPVEETVANVSPADPSEPNADMFLLSDAMVIEFPTFLAGSGEYLADAGEDAARDNQ